MSNHLYAFIYSYVGPRYLIFIYLYQYFALSLFLSWAFCQSQFFIVVIILFFIESIYIETVSVFPLNYRVAVARCNLEGDRGAVYLIQTDL